MSSLSLALPSLSTLESSLSRTRHQSDPAQWIRERLNEHIWSKQRAIIQSVVDHRRTAVYSCHKIGKSFIAARIGAHWIESHRPGEASVVTTSRRGRQVKAVVWKEWGRVHAKGKLIGRMNQTELYIIGKDGNEELVAFGQKPGDKDTGAFQGPHAKYMLVIIDEACYIPASIWDSIDTLVANDHSRILAIGNPDDPNTEFAKVCKPGSGWNSIGISYLDTPNFTGEKVPRDLSDVLIGPTWVEEKRRKWGEDNPIFISKVLGRFPEISTGGLIPASWVAAAQDRTLQPSINTELGVDVGAGGDESVVCMRQGPVARIIRTDHNPDTMQTCGNIIHDMKRVNAYRVKVDEYGIGQGIVNRAHELGYKQIIGVKVGRRDHANKEDFHNLRADGYWQLRERFMEGSIDIDANDEDLAAQLVGLQFKRTSDGKVIMESKEDIRRSGRPSPDRADALMLAYLDPPPDKGKVRSGLLW